MYEAKIIADSISPAGVRLTTMEITFPRIVLAEFNTHRMFSRNAASSRAIPVAKMLERVKSDPFIPVWWGKNQSGMQANEELTGDYLKSAQDGWLQARDKMIFFAEELMRVGLHKQVANRLLEPFTWVTDIVTGTDYSNFFALRCHPAAQPEIRLIAEKMRDLYTSSTPTPLPYGRWHLPYITAEDIQYAIREFNDHRTESGFLRKVSVARCAAVSYVRQGEKREYDKDLALCDRLSENGHWSPFEHVARPIDRKTDSSVGYRLSFEEKRSTVYWSGNFREWHQFRKEFPNENR